MLRRGGGGMLRLDNVKGTTHQALIQRVLRAKGDLFNVHLLDDVPGLFVNDVEPQRGDLRVGLGRQ